MSIMATWLHAIGAFVAHLRESLNSRDEFSAGYIGASSFMTAVLVLTTSIQ